MTLSPTPTLGAIGAIIFMLLHVPVTVSPPFFLLLLTVLSLKAFLADQPTAPAGINCALARCLGAGEQLLGDLVADVTENSCVETSIPWQLLTQLHSVAFFMLRLSLHP